MRTRHSEFQKSFRPYRHLVFFALAYGGLIACCPLVAQLVMSKSGTLAITGFAFALCGAAIALVTGWSVLGPGSYWTRLLWSHATGAIVMPGVGLVTWSISDLPERYDIVLILVLPVVLGAQLPFWFFRGCFGGQFVLDDQAPTSGPWRFSLADLFALTLVFALCFAVPHFLVELDSVKRPVYNPDTGSLPVTARLTVSWIYAVFAICGGVIGVFSMLTLPIFLFVFRIPNRVNGCAVSCCYGAGLALTCVTVTATVTGELSVFEHGGFFSVFIATLYAGLVAIPLSCSRSAGFRLTSRRLARTYRSTTSRDVAGSVRNAR